MDELAEKIKDFSEEVEKKYDEKLEKLRMPEEEENPELRVLEEAYAELSRRISEARKRGADVFAANNFLLGFKGALQAAKAFNSERDLEKARLLKEKAEAELEESLNKPSLNVREEVEVRAEKLLKDSEEEL